MQYNTTQPKQIAFRSFRLPSICVFTFFARLLRRVDNFFYHYNRILLLLLLLSWLARVFTRITFPVCIPYEKYLSAGHKTSMQPFVNPEWYPKTIYWLPKRVTIIHINPKIKQLTIQSITYGILIARMFLFFVMWIKYPLTLFKQFPKWDHRRYIYNDIHSAVMSLYFFCHLMRILRQLRELQEECRSQSYTMLHQAVSLKLGSNFVCLQLYQPFQLFLCITFDIHTHNGWVLFFFTESQQTIE